MRLTFIGADHEVTGSCHMITACGKTFLIDYGMEQGVNLFENIEIPVKPSDIDFVLVTHAHIDHTGMLPYLYKNGFTGAIYATEGTCDLCSVMLRDSAHIQESEAKWKNRKAKRAGQPLVEPLYTVSEAEDTVRLFIPCPYGKIVEISEGIRVRFQDVGHLLGSASIEIWLTEDGIEKKIVFSGDVGNYNQPIIRDPQKVKEADYVVVESTYGNRVHDPAPDYVGAFSKILQETFDQGGNVVVPSFAVGRTQEILYFIREIKEKELIKGHENFEVYIDSPLAIEATTIFDRHGPDCFDEEAKALVEKGVRPFIFPNLKTTTSSEESKQINFNMAPKLILSASGMCDAGRIRHHLKHNLWREECTVCFVGYQAEGTLGRRLIDGEKVVKIFGETIEVRARIESLKGVSGHADMNGLLDWLSGFEKKPERVFVVHGEDTVTDEFAKTVTERFEIPAMAPYSGGEIDLLTGECIKEGVRKIVSKKAREKKMISVFERLRSAGYRLLSVIAANEGGTNKDLTAFTNQVNALCEKWEKK